MGRLLVGLTTLLLAVMPLTEHLWTWDKFLRGGPDFEFGLLGIASILCLVLVLSQHYKHGDQSVAHHATLDRARLVSR
jgi:hypothetical protein